jgi:hypothetical protein
VLLFWLLPAPAFAHGMSRFLSTPVSPPAGFLWVILYSAVVMTMGTALVLRRRCGLALGKGIGLSLAGFALFGVAFMLVGIVAGAMTTAPPPGLALGFPVFWGWGWREVGHLFIQWNGLGLLMFTACMFWFVRRAAQHAQVHSCKKTVLVLSPVLYLLCLLPYLFTGALASGRPGSYTLGACGLSLRQMGSALVKYSQIHDGKLPAGRTTAEILLALEPYLLGRWRSYRIDVCPVRGPFEAKPEPYRWNQEVAGKSLAELAELPLPVVVLACPYPSHGSSRLLTSDLLVPCTLSPELCD